MGSLAWPAAAVILGLIFRRQLRAVFAGLAERMKHLSSLKAPWTEMSFSDGVFAARTELAEIAANGDQAVLQYSRHPKAGASRSRPWLAWRRYRRLDDALADRDADDYENYEDEDEYEDWDDAPDVGDDSELTPEQRFFRQGRSRDSKRPAAASPSLPDYVTVQGRDGPKRYNFRALTPANLADEAQASPEVTVLSAWAYIETTINGLAEKLGLDEEPDLLLRITVVARDLHNHGRLPGAGNVESLIRRLLALRRDVADGRPVTKLEAYDYAATALRVAKLLRDAYEAAPEEPADAPPDEADSSAQP